MTEFFAGMSVMVVNMNMKGSKEGKINGKGNYGARDYVWSRQKPSGGRSVQNI